MVLWNYFLLIIVIICLHIVIWFQVFHTNTNNFPAVLQIDKGFKYSYLKLIIFKHLHIFLLADILF